MKTTILALLLSAGLFGQGQPPNRVGKPNNVWGDAINIPTLSSRTVIATACSVAKSVGWLTNYCEVGYYPVAGATIFLTTYTTNGSGYHAHDGNGNTARPQASIVSSQMQTADNSGNAYYTFSLPGYAGYYTFEATFASLSGKPSVKGINYYGKDFDTWSIDESLQIVMSGNPLVNYILDPNVNNASPYFDFGHSNQVLYMASEVSNLVEKASVQYVQNSLQFLGYYDRMMLVRASLPDGGINDDYTVLLTQGTSAWQGTTPFRMENAEGTEVDIKNPRLSPTGVSLPGVNPAAADLMTAAMYTQKCYLGAYPAAFTPQAAIRGIPDRESYWYQQPMIHYSCGVQALHRPGPIVH